VKRHNTELDIHIYTHNLSWYLTYHHRTGGNTKHT